jgi:hypothetical protein
MTEGHRFASCKRASGAEHADQVNAAVCERGMLLRKGELVLSDRDATGTRCRQAGTCRPRENFLNRPAAEACDVGQDLHAKLGGPVVDPKRWPVFPPDP